MIDCELTERHFVFCRAIFGRDHRSCTIIGACVDIAQESFPGLAHQRRRVLLPDTDSWLT